MHQIGINILHRLAGLLALITVGWSNRKHLRKAAYRCLRKGCHILNSQN